MILDWDFPTATWHVTYLLLHYTGSRVIIIMTKVSNIILHILSTSMSLYYFEWKCPSLAVKSVVILLKCLASSAKKWPLRSKCSSLPQDGWSESCEKPINIASKWWCIQRAKHPKHDLIITLKSLQLSSYPKFYTIYCDAKG